MSNISKNFFDSVKYKTDENDIVVSFGDKEYYAIVDGTSYGPFNTKEKANNVKNSKREYINNRLFNIISTNNAI